MVSLILVRGLPPPYVIPAQRSGTEVRQPPEIMKPEVVNVFITFGLFFTGFKELRFFVRLRLRAI